MRHHSDTMGNGGLGAACRFGTRSVPNVDCCLGFHHISQISDFDVVADALDDACAKVKKYAAPQNN